MQAAVRRAALPPPDAGTFLFVDLGPRLGDTPLLAFLESLERTIHVEVRKLDSEAYVPTVLVEGARVENLEGFADVFKAACGRRGPFLIEFRI